MRRQRAYLGQANHWSEYPIFIGMFRAFSGWNQVDWGLLTSTAVLHMLTVMTQDLQNMDSFVLRSVSP